MFQRKNISKKIVEYLWKKYYIILWSTRLYVWNPIKHKIERLFEEADWQVRIRVEKILNK